MAYYETYMPNENGELQRVVINAGVGFCLPFYGEVAPPGTLACDGSEISRGAYKELFAVLGTKAGAGDGVSTFNLPDFRGDFIRCVGGNAAALGVEQGDAIRNITGCVTGIVVRGGSDKPGSALKSIPSGGNATANPQINDGANFYSEISFSVEGVVPTSAENRPVNVALLWCIIYE